MRAAERTASSGYLVLVSETVDWIAKSAGGKPPIRELLSAVEELGKSVTERPNRISDTLRDAADRLSYPLMTTSAESSGKALIETYPHPAILHRVPTKSNEPAGIGPLAGRCGGRFW